MSLDTAELLVGGAEVVTSTPWDRLAFIVAAVMGAVFLALLVALWKHHSKLVEGLPVLLDRHQSYLERQERILERIEGELRRLRQ